MTSQSFGEAEAATLIKQVESLSVEIAELKEQRDKLNAEAKSWLRKGEALVDEARNLKREVRQLRDELKELRVKIRGLKEKLGEVREKLAEKRNLRDELREQIRRLRSMVSIPKGKAEQLFEELEWQIQTNPLTPEEERRLVERVKNLESQLNLHGKIGELFEKLNHYRQEIQTLKGEAENLRGQLDEAYEKLKSQIRLVEEKSKRIEEAEAEAKEAYQRFTEAKRAADRLHSQLIELLNRQRSLKDELRRIRRGREEEALAKMLRELEEAYKQGKKKKLTLEEFKLLMSRGLI
ncbi:MAG: coiled-coil protein [Candidatus Hecatellaceae archaeon]